MRNLRKAKENFETVNKITSWMAVSNSSEDEPLIGILGRRNYRSPAGALLDAVALVAAKR